jgi:hypothetical protein
MIDPVIILACPHSFTSVFGAMLGQHPELRDLPEVNLFVAEKMGDRARDLSGQPYHQHGLLRAAAELFAGEQTADTIARARLWLQSRRERACVSVFRELAQKAQPRTIVEKSPRTTLRVEYMRRARLAFPDARFIHLIRHPTGHARTIWRKATCDVTPAAPAARTRGEKQARFSAETDKNRKRTGAARAADSYIKMWYTRNVNIDTFLAGVPEQQKLRIRGEDVLQEPARHLRAILEWLGLAVDEPILDAMKHPEYSKFAEFGPTNARFGCNPGFLESPHLRSHADELPSIESPITWHEDGRTLSPEVRELARELRYG